MEIIGETIFGYEADTRIEFKLEIQFRDNSLADSFASSNSSDFQLDSKRKASPKISLITKHFLNQKSFEIITTNSGRTC